MKKKQTIQFLDAEKFRKILLIMRIVVFLLIVGMNQISASVYSQKKQLVSFNFEKISFKEILWEIQKQTDIVFMYGEDDIKGIHNFYVKAKNSDPIEIIKKCIKDSDVEMKIVNDVVVLMKKNIPQNLTIQPTIVVTGVVTSIDGAPLPGATVQIKGTGEGTITDLNGNYTIEVPSNETILIFSYIGYKTMEVEVNDKTVIDISLEEDITSLGEVVIVNTGYQKMPNDRLSGAYEVISGKLFEERPNADIASSLDGAVAGFQRIVKTNPDGSLYYENRIRGQSTLTQDIANPLIIVDGFPVEDADFSTIDPNTVESVTILKDAAAASIWGARASNGVIVITTKIGKGANRFEVKVNAFTRIGNDLDLAYINPIANTETQIAWEKYVYDNNLTGNLTPGLLGEVTTALSPSLTLYNEYQLGNISETEYNSQIANLQQYNYQDDVYDHLLRKNVYQQYSVSIAGSTEKNNYSFSVLHDISKLNFVGNDKQKTLISFRDNFKIRDWLRLSVGATAGLQKSKNNGVSLSNIELLPPYQRLLGNDGSYVPMVKDYYLPILDTISANSDFPYENWNYNLLQEVHNRDRQTNSNTIRLQAGLNATIIKGLVWDGKIQYEKVESKNEDIYNEDSYLVRNQVNLYNEYDPATGEVTVLSGDGYAYPKGNALDRSSVEHESYILRNQLQFDREIFGNQRIMVLLGSEVSSYVSSSSQQVRIWGYDDDKLSFANQPFYDDYGARRFFTTSGTRLEPGREWNSTYRDKRFFSLFGNFSYTYNRKYTVTGSVRTDASNMIVKDPKYRYAPFWSIGGRWSIDEEGFMKNIGNIDRLQLRAAYGVSGNVVTSTSVVPLISYSSRPFYITEQDYARVNDFGNPLLRWEKTETINLGIDYSFFKNKLAGKIDLYSKHSEDVLADVDIAGAYGLNYSNAINAAEVLNRGFELEIASSLQIVNDLGWKGKLIVSQNINEVKKLDVNSYYPARLTMSSVFVEGKPVSPVYSYIYEGEEDGIPMIRFEDGELTEIFNIPSTSDARNFMQYEGSLIPSTELGFSNSFGYKGITLSALIIGRFGHVFRTEAPDYPLLNSSAFSTLRKPMEEVVNGSPDKFPGLPPTTIASLSAYNIVKYFNTLVEDASNIRLKEITLSYSIPKEKLGNLGISNVRFYSQVNNIGILWKATKTYYDPDYPTFKNPVSYLFGINVTF